MTVATAVRQFGPANAARFGAAMPAGHRRALEALAACRTAAMGGHVAQCDACEIEHFVYHSCRHRQCPTCHGASTRAWTAARAAELLPVPYCHVVFTLPAEFRALVRSHQRVLLGALMQTAAEALQALAADEHYLGGTVGILAVLHTWTRTLVYHPHVHCLVPGGALAPDGTWRMARGTYLVPVRALSVGFRARFLMRWKRLLPEVVIPASVWKKPWGVYAKPTVQGTDCVLRYLARYVHRAAITDARIVRVDATTVTFRYQAASTPGWRTMTLPGEEFLRRFLQHVLPRGFHKVRYYGFWRPQAVTTRVQLQDQLAPPPTPSCTSSPATLPSGLAAARRCPHCTSGHPVPDRRLPRRHGGWRSSPSPGPRSACRPAPSRRRVCRCVARDRRDVARACATVKLLGRSTANAAIGPTSRVSHHHHRRGVVAHAAGQDGWRRLIAGCNLQRAVPRGSVQRRFGVGYATQNLLSVMPQERFTLTENRHSEYVLTFTSECAYELGSNAAHGERGTAT
jgi:hypothetical protein